MKGINKISNLIAILILLFIVLGVFFSVNIISIAILKFIGIEYTHISYVFLFFLLYEIVDLFLSYFLVNPLKSSVKKLNLNHKKRLMILINLIDFSLGLLTLSLLDMLMSTVYLSSKVIVIFVFIITLVNCILDISELKD